MLELEDLEVIQQYGGWDETRDEYMAWVRKDQVREIIERYRTALENCQRTGWDDDKGWRAPNTRGMVGDSWTGNW